MTENFFQCVARGLQNKYKPKFIHNQTLIHFARILFTQATECETIPEILSQHTNPEWTVSRHACIHPAIKAWISRVHTTEKIYHKDPLDWFDIYPKLLKGLAFRFIYYHRSYTKKPNRLFSARVFAHLVAELYNCRICLDKKRWIYPIDSDDYIIQNNMITIRLESSPTDAGKFMFQPEELQESLIVVAVAKPIAPERNDLFMLRRYSVENLQVGSGKRHTNCAIGILKTPPAGKRVHQIEYSPLVGGGGNEDLYQIYPGNLSKTFYEPFSPGYGLHVFLASKKPGTNEQLSVAFAAQTEYHDQYVYFQLHPTTSAILVVYAKDQKDAEDAILKETPYSL